MANYPIQTVAFTNKQDLQDSVIAADVNLVYAEVIAIGNDLGAGNMGTGTPGLRYSPAWGNATFDSSTVIWTGLAARLKNIENGVYTAFTNRVDTKSGTGQNTIQSADANNVGLTIKTGTLTASITSASSDSTSVTYNANNTFKVGQKVTVTGLTTTTGASLNVSLKTITSRTNTSFTIDTPSVTLPGSTSGTSNQLTVTGDASAIVTGMLIAGTNIATGATVSSISGQSITMSANSTGTVSGNVVFRLIGTANSQSGTATAYQATSLQEWQKSDATVVASISPNGDLVAAGNATFSGNLSVTGTTSLTGALSLTGGLTTAGELIANVINGGTP